MSRKRKGSKKVVGDPPKRCLVTAPPVPARSFVCKALLATASYQIVSLFLGATDLPASAGLPGHGIDASGVVTSQLLPLDPAALDAAGARPVQLACIGCVSGPDNVGGRCVAGTGGCGCTSCTGCQECKRCIDCTGCTGCISLTTNESKSAHHFRIGVNFEKEGNWAAAEQAFRTALGHYPNWANYHYHLAYVLAQQGRKNEAVDAYKETVRIDPGEKGAFSNLVRLLFNELGRRDEAEEWANRFVQAHRGDEDVRKLLVEVVNIRRSETESRLFDEAYAADEKAGNAKAEELWRKYLLLKPESASGWNNLGIALDAQGKRLAAEAAYRRAAELDPSSELYGGNLQKVVGNPERNRALQEALAAKEQGQAAKKLADAFKIEAAKGQSMVCFDDARGCAYTKDHSTESLVYAPVPTPRKPPAAPPEAVRKDPAFVRLTAEKESAEKEYRESHDALQKLWEKRDAAKGTERGTVEVKIVEVRDRLTELRSGQRVKELEIEKVYRNHGVKMEDL